MRGLGLLWVAAVALLALWIQLRVIPSFEGVAAESAASHRAPLLLIVPWALGFGAVSLLVRRRIRRGALGYSASVAAQCAALFLAGGLLFLLIFAALDFVPLIAG